MQRCREAVLALLVLKADLTDACFGSKPWVPLLSEKVLGWLAEMVSHRWNVHTIPPPTHTELWSVKRRRGHSHFCTRPVANVGKSLRIFSKGCVSWVLAFTKQQDWCVCLCDRQWRIHCTPGESIKSYWSHANPLRSCLDWSNTTRSRMSPRLWYVLLLLIRWQYLVLSDGALVGEEVVTCRKGRWNAGAALADGHLDAAVWAQCLDAGVGAEILGRRKRKSNLESYRKFGLWHLSRKTCGIQHPQGALHSVGQRARGAEEYDLGSILRRRYHCFLALCPGLR